MYKVIYGFIDAVEKRNYKVGDEFIVGPNTDEKRIAKLSGYTNSILRPLIEKVEDAEKTVEPTKKKTKTVSNGE